MQIPACSITKIDDLSFPSHFTGQLGLNRHQGEEILLEMVDQKVPMVIHDNLSDFSIHTINVIGESIT